MRSRAQPWFRRGQTLDERIVELFGGYLCPHGNAQAYTLPADAGLEWAFWNRGRGACLTCTLTYMATLPRFSLEPFADDVVVPEWRRPR